MGVVDAFELSGELGAQAARERGRDLGYYIRNPEGDCIIVSICSRCNWECVKVKTYLRGASLAMPIS